MNTILRPLSLCTLALVAGGAQAQVTLYGRANIDFEKISIGGTAASDAFGSNQRVSSNSSRFGLRAAKDFEGLKVFAQVETGVSWDAGGDTIAGRDTFAGLEGGWGKLRLGKMDTPFKELGGLTDRFKGTGIQDDGSIAGLGGSGNGFARRQNNSLRYDSPEFGGFKLSAQYGVENEDTGTGTQKKVLELGGEFAHDALKAGAVIAQHRNFTAGKTDTAYRLGVNYDFKVVNIGAGFNQLRYDLANGTARRSYATVTAGVPIGNGAINLRYGKAGNVSGSAPAGTTVAGADGANLVVGPDSGARQFTLGYEHNLFKGAQLYAYWTKVSNEANANYRFGVNALNVAAADKGASPSGFVVGMVYDF
jgi:predicted porin